MYKIVSLYSNPDLRVFQHDHYGLPANSWIQFGFPPFSGTLTVFFSDGATLSGPIEKGGWVKNEWYFAEPNGQGYYYPPQVDGVLCVTSQMNHDENEFWYRYDHKTRQYRAIE